MSTVQTEQFPVSWAQVTAFRLARHHLLARAPKKDLVAVTSSMTGAQAQLLSAAQMSLWTRVNDLEIANVEAAMANRKLVKASCMRRTLFLVPSNELAVFVRGSAGRAEKEIRWALGKGVPERTVEAAINAALGALDEPRTRPEIAERACRTLGVQTASYQGGGWGSRRSLAAVPVGHLNYPVVELLHLAGARGVICYGPPRGKEPTFVRADAWIPRWKDLSREEAEVRLLHKYLQAFGPATAADFAMWSGLNLTTARKIWTTEQARLAQVNVDGWAAAVLRKDLQELTQAKFERPAIRILPYFDTFLIGHRNRDHLALAHHRPQIYRPQGWIAPVVLVDGRAVAVWEQAQEKDMLQIKVRPFEALSHRILTGIQKQAKDLGRFLRSSKVEVQIV